MCTAKGPPAGDKLNKEKINMKLQNLIHILIGILCIGPLPRAQAVVPPPDGGYPNFTTAEGTNALQNLTTGAANTGLVGVRSFQPATANFNTGVGAGALVLNTGDSNTAVGTAALLLNTTATRTRPLELPRLFSNDTGPLNTAVGYQALSANVSGLENTAIGDQALLKQHPATSTWPSVVPRSLTTRRATKTRQSGVARSMTPPANDNTAWAFKRGSRQPTGDGNVYIGSGMHGVAGEANHTYVRNINTTSVNGMRKRYRLPSTYLPACLVT